MTLRMRFGHVAAALIVAAVLTPAATFGQATTGELTGRVVDPSGAPVPGVAITVRSVDTGLVRTATTGESGDYLFVLLPPGRYNVEAELAGFKKVTHEAVTINVGTRLTLPMKLEVGAVTESVMVSGQSALMETTRSDLGGVITPTEITNLPLLNRTFANLSVVMPEARPAGNFDPTKTRTGNVAMNGGDGRQLDVNVDGGDNKDNVVGSLIQNFAYESIQEFQVLQHRWTAESGRAVGGVINVITKSGTNDLRGSLFGTYRDQDLAAKDFFQKRGITAKQTFERWEYGGSAGGPIARDRLFFFGALERFDEPQGRTPVRADAIQQMAFIPDGQAVSEIATPYVDTLFTGKADHRLSSNQSMFYRFSLQKNSSDNDQVSNPALTNLSGGSTNLNDIYDFVANHTLNIGGNRLNQFAFHFQDFKNEILGVSDDPIMIFAGGFRTGPAPNTPQQTTSRKFQFRNDFTWQRNAHALKTGVNYINTKLGGYFYFGAFGYQITWFDTPQTIATNTARYPQGFATPGAPNIVSFFEGEASHNQTFHQLALYAQDDWRVNSKLTLNLGLRWDANIGLLTDQTNNRTMALLSELDDPRAQAIAGDQGRLSRGTPSWKEFQPRLGFAFDPRGDGSSVIRGGYGLFYDQIFQNLTIFSLSQSGPEIYLESRVQNTDVGVGGAANYRFGVDPLPTFPPLNFAELPVGSFGRINDPGMTDPHVHKFSIGYQRAVRGTWTVSADYVHTRGYNEGRVQVINPQIRSVCDPTFPGSTPSDPRCVAGASTRYFDAAFVRAGLGANRLSQINMIGTTNESRFDSLTATLKGRLRRGMVSISYVLANSRAWGGQPTASYSGNGIAITPDEQFRDNEWGPTRLDERHRVVASGVIEAPFGFQFAPIVQFASARPYTPVVGFDINGDGQINIVDRLCEGVDPAAVFAVRGDVPAIRALNPNGCQLARVNSQRSGLVVNADGTVEERSGHFFNADLRITKGFSFGRRAVKIYADLFNLFNTENLSFTLRPEQSAANVASSFMQPVSLYGPGFGPPVGRPFTASFGARFEF